VNNLAARAAIAVMLAEFVPILLLVALVAIVGPSSAQSPEALAVQLGQWVGPIGGALAVLVAARWAVRASPRKIAHGAGIGAAAAALDAGLLLAGGTPFEWLFAASWAGRIAAGAAGGAVARQA
jgi:hypothetical protein